MGESAISNVVLAEEYENFLRNFEWTLLFGKAHEKNCREVAPGLSVRTGAGFPQMPRWDSAFKELGKTATRACKIVACKVQIVNERHSVEACLIRVRRRFDADEVIKQQPANVRFLI